MLTAESVSWKLTCPLVPRPYVGDAGISETSTTITDPSYYYQQSYFSAPSDVDPSGMDVPGAWELIGDLSASDPIDVVVMDSSFYQNEEIPYYDGRNFLTTALIHNGPRQVISDDYAPPTED
jgi:serine protease